MSESYATPADIAANQSDAMSPTNMIHRFLAQKGLPLTSENIRRAVTENAQNPGYIPGLMNNEPAAPDPTPMNLLGDRGTAQATAPAQAATQEMPIPPVPPTVTNSTASSPASGAPAQDLQSMPLVEMIGAAVLGALPFLFGNRGTPTAPGMAQPNSLPTERSFPSATAERVPQGPEIVGRAPPQIEGTVVNNRGLPPPTPDATMSLGRGGPPPTLPGGGGAANAIPTPTPDPRANKKVPMPTGLQATTGTAEYVQPKTIAELRAEKARIQREMARVLRKPPVSPYRIPR